MLGSVDGPRAVHDGDRSNSRDERREPSLAGEDMVLGLSSKREVTRTRGGHPVPVSGRPEAEPAPHRNRVDPRRGHHHPGESTLYRPSGVEPAAHRQGLIDPANVSLGHESVQRWNLPDGWGDRCGASPCTAGCQPGLTPRRTAAGRS
jgi:hypothetical protein